MSFISEALSFKDKRQPISLSDLEAAIGEVVTKSGQGCEGFVGVVIRRKVPASPRDVNWEVKGVRFGCADRDSASKALEIVLEGMQREFRLAEPD